MGGSVSVWNIQPVKQGQIGPAKIVALVNQRKPGDAGHSVAHTIPKVELGGVSSPAEAKKGGEGDPLVLITKRDPFRMKRIEKRGQGNPRVHPAPAQHQSRLQQARSSHGDDLGLIEQFVKPFAPRLSQNGADNRRSLQQHQ